MNLLIYIPPEKNRIVNGALRNYFYDTLNELEFVGYGPFKMMERRHEVKVTFSYRKTEFGP